MTNQIRNRLATKLPIALTTTYFVVGGVVYLYKTFHTNCPKYLAMVKQSDLAVLDTGDIIKNRGIVDVTVLTAEIQKVVSLGGVEEYDSHQLTPTLYFVEVPESRLETVLEAIKTTRAIAASTLSLYK